MNLKHARRSSGLSAKHLAGDLAGNSAGRRLRRFAGLGLVALALPLAAAAQEAFTRGAVNLRAGPAGDYPVVARLAPGQPVQVLGCTSGYSWCDVVLPDELRGWVFAQGLDYAYDRRRVPVATYGAAIGIPLVTFALGSYWSDHYRDRPWYGERRWWRGSPPPPVAGWRPPPPPRPAWQPNPWGGPGFGPGGPGRPGYGPPPDRRPEFRPGPGFEPPRGRPPGPGYGPPGAGFEPPRARPPGPGYGPPGAGFEPPRGRPPGPGFAPGMREAPLGVPSPRGGDNRGAPAPGTGADRP